MAQTDAIKHFNDANFQAGIAKGIVLVDFYTEWCSPCRMLAPIVEELAREMSGRVTVAKVNTDEAPDTATKYEVYSIPTLILFKNGEVVNRVVGLKDLNALRRMIADVF
jgi:thioredoxin 1